MGKIIQLIFKSTVFYWMFTKEKCQQGRVEYSQYLTQSDAIGTHSRFRGSATGCLVYQGQEIIDS